MTGIGWPGSRTDHMEGHLMAPRIQFEAFTPPAVAVLASGGHSQIVHEVDDDPHTELMDRGDQSDRSPPWSRRSGRRRCNRLRRSQNRPGGVERCEPDGVDTEIGGIVEFGLDRGRSPMPSPSLSAKD
jgi:hypothetical protein